MDRRAVVLLRRERDLLTEAIGALEKYRKSRSIRARLARQPSASVHCQADTLHAETPNRSRFQARNLLSFRRRPTQSN
jgi:hypothetical protein